MRKSVPYALATLIIASSSNAMMGVEKNPGQQSSYVSAYLEVPQEIQNTEDNIEKIIVQLLALPTSKQPEELYNKIKYLKKLYSYNKKSEEKFNIENEKRRVIFSYVTDNIWLIKMSPKDERSSIILRFFIRLRAQLISSAQKEMNKYNYQKDVQSESYKNSSSWEKGIHFMAHLLVDTSDHISNELEATKFNSRWYKIEGHKVELKDYFLNPVVRQWVEHTKKCSEFLQENNIQ